MDLFLAFERVWGGEIMSHCVTQAGLKFASTLLLWPPKCEPNKCEPACPGLFLASSAVTSHLCHYHFNYDSCLWFLLPFNVLTSAYNTSRSLFRTEKHRPGTMAQWVKALRVANLMMWTQFPGPT